MGGHIYSIQIVIAEMLITIDNILLIEGEKTPFHFGEFHCDSICEVCLTQFWERRQCYRVEEDGIINHLY